MLSDPLNINVVSVVPDPTAIGNDLGASSLSLFLTDAGDGSSKRIGTLSGVKAQLSIAHSQSNENAPFPTTRTNIRLDLKKVNTETGKTITASAYTVVVAPQGPDFSDADILMITRTLAAFLLFGKGTGDMALDFYGNDDTLARVVAGEP
jgi:hypothetical protein